MPAARGPFSRGPYIMCGPLPLARGPFSLSMNPSELILVTRASRTENCPRADLFYIASVAYVDSILSNVYGPPPFSLTFYMLRADLCPSLADRFHSPGVRDPEWTFLVTPASRADHSLREWTFFYC